MTYRVPALDADWVQYTMRSSFKLFDNLARQLIVTKWIKLSNPFLEVGVREM